jgi:hypothetical protein
MGQRKVVSDAREKLQDQKIKKVHGDRFEVFEF